MNNQDFIINDSDKTLGAVAAEKEDAITFVRYYHTLNYPWKKQKYELQTF